MGFFGSIKDFAGDVVTAPVDFAGDVVTGGIPKVAGFAYEPFDYTKDLAGDLATGGRRNVFRSVKKAAITSYEPFDYVKDLGGDLATGGRRNVFDDPIIFAAKKTYRGAAEAKDLAGDFVTGGIPTVARRAKSAAANVKDQITGPFDFIKKSIIIYALIAVALIALFIWKQDVGAISGNVAQGAAAGAVPG